MCQKSECPHKGDVMCSCKEIQGPDWVEKIVCLFQNIHEPKAELFYMTLDAPYPYRLCVSGSCKRCGGRLCIHLDRGGVRGKDDFLAMVYRRLYQMFNVDFGMEIKAFRQMFLDLFHEQDRPYIQYWLTLLENQGISQMYRSIGNALPPQKECEISSPALEEGPVKVYTIVQTAVNVSAKTKVEEVYKKIKEKFSD